MGRKEKNMNENTLERTFELKDGTAGERLVVRAKPLGGGGQGSVYFMPAQNGMPEKAVKVLKNSSPEFREHIKALTETKFHRDLPVCRPEKWFETTGGEFGYIMELIGEGFVEYSELIKAVTEQRKDNIPRLTALCRICYELSDIIRYIHGKGWLYLDFSEKNFAFHPQYGLVQIFDSENMVDMKDAAKGTTFISGSFGTMAPELLLNEAKPNEDTDNFALASVIFQLFLYHYPYDAKAMIGVVQDQEYYQEHHGRKPVFAFSAKNKAALPRKGTFEGLWEKWDAMPYELREMFVRAFEQGAKNPKVRPKPEEWMALFSELSTKVMYCPDCRCEVFVNGETSYKCPECGKTVKVEYLHLRYGERKRMLSLFKNQQISPYQSEPGGGEEKAFSFHQAVIPVAGILIDADGANLVNLDPRKVRWFCQYGVEDEEGRVREITQYWEFGEGGLLAESIYVLIPLCEENCILTCGEEGGDA